MLGRLSQPFKSLVYNVLKQLEHCSQSSISSMFVCLVNVGEKFLL